MCPDCQLPVPRGVRVVYFEVAVTYHSCPHCARKWKDIGFKGVAPGSHEVAAKLEQFLKRYPVQDSEVLRDTKRFLESKVSEAQREHLTKDKALRKRRDDLWEKKLSRQLSGDDYL